jgi:hypothetical protein
MDENHSPGTVGDQLKQRREAMVLDGKSMHRREKANAF